MTARSSSTLGEYFSALFFFALQNVLLHEYLGTNRRIGNDRFGDSRESREGNRRPYPTAPIVENGHGPPSYGSIDSTNSYQTREWLQSSSPGGSVIVDIGRN